MTRLSFRRLCQRDPIIRAYLGLAGLCAALGGLWALWSLR